MPVSRRLTLVSGLIAILLFAGCIGGGTFRTFYETPIPETTARGWTVTEVRVSVPESLVVSEENIILPNADIVWQEELPGDRRAQVAAIIRTAAEDAVSGLDGPLDVHLNITVTRFHALTRIAETRLHNIGVHNVNFVAWVTDAETGAILAEPQPIDAEMPAMSGDVMREARARGETQKSQITAHVTRTIAGWFSLGPDPRGSFIRSGG